MVDQTSAAVLISDGSIASVEGALMNECSPDGACIRIQDPREQTLMNESERWLNCEHVIKSQKDVSDSTKAQESIGQSSEVDSPSSSCVSERAQYYHNKLLATLQILQNKEETVRVQAESLSVAEARISSLSARTADLNRQIQTKELELQALRKKVEEYRREKSDVSVTAQIQEIDNQKNIVKTLQNNLEVIEDLYRECFYEMAKQDGFVEMLRKSYLDVRLQEKEKADQISKLQYVVSTQKWSLDKCQVIAADVENLKVEISNFLNSSNNDSGVWEESVTEGLAEDLQDITQQLLRLRELLTRDCSCGLKEENTRLKQDNEAMEIQINSIRQKIVDLEVIIENKESVERQCTELINAKECELHAVRQQVAGVETEARERAHACDTLKQQLQQTEALLHVKSAESARLQALCQQHEDTMKQLTEDLDRSKDIAKEYCALRVCACAAQRRVRSLRAELARALRHCAHLDDTYRGEVESLAGALAEARRRGAALCAAAERAADAFREYLHRERELIKQKDTQIRLLERRLRQNVDLTRENDKDTCVKCVSAKSVKLSVSKSSQRCGSASDAEPTPTCSKYLTQNEGSFTSGSSKGRQRREDRLDTSASEIADSSTPAPPERPSQIKKLFCDNRLCEGVRERSTQHPTRRDAATRVSRRCTRCDCDVACAHLHTLPRCALGDVCERMRCAGAALQGAARRWRPHPAPHPTPRTPRPHVN